MHHKDTSLKDFYLSIAATHHVCEEIAKKNIHLAEQKLIAEEIKIIDDKDLDPSLAYLLSFVGTKKDLIIQLFNKMIEYRFDSIESVEKNFNSFGPESSRYKMLNVVNLFDHTMHVAIEMAEMLAEGKYPKEMISTCLVIAILHDFGKAPQIQLDFREETNQRHWKVSANFAKQFLVQYSKKNRKTGVNEGFINTVFETLFQHHDVDRKKNGAFLDLLIKADRTARDKELLLIRGNKRSLL